MKTLQEYICDLIWPSESILEMATISKNEKWGNDSYRIAVHGPASGDRDNPHIHIYLSSDNKPYNQFNFEISLIDILCYDEINLIYQRDENKRKRLTNRNKCSWEGYKKIKEGFEDWLFDICKLPGDFIDNLDAIIYWYNQESNSENFILDYINERGLKILDKYLKYFK